MSAPSGTLSGRRGRFDRGESLGQASVHRPDHADATVTLTKTSADVSLSSTSLTFTASNFSTAQTVTGLPRSMMMDTIQRDRHDHLERIGRDKRIGRHPVGQPSPTMTLPSGSDRGHPDRRSDLSHGPGRIDR